MLGKFDPHYHTKKFGHVERDGDEIGNSSFLKKVIRKQTNPVGAYNKRAKREDSESEEEE